MMKIMKFGSQIIIVTFLSLGFMFTANSIAASAETQSPAAAAKNVKTKKNIKPADNQPAINSKALELNQEGVALGNSLNYKEAVEKLEEAYALEPQNETIKNNLFTIINNYAVYAGNKKNSALAYEIYEKAVAIEGAPYNIFMNYGNFLSSQGKYEESTSYLEKALTAGTIPQKDEEFIRSSLGASYLKRGLYDEAITHMEHAITLNHKNAELYYGLGKIYYMQGKYSNAIENLELAVANGKNTPYLKPAQELLDKVKKEGKVESKFESKNLYHFNVQYDGEKNNAVNLDKVMEILEDAYNAVGTYFNYYPEAATPVIIYSKEQFKQASDSPIWVAALYDGKIRLPLSDIQENSDTLKSLIFHEYTHAVVFQLTRGKCPVWLNEGLAQTLEGTGMNEKQAARLKKYAEQKKIFDIKSLEGSFMGIQPYELVALAYSESLSFTGYLIEKYGQSQLIEALSEIGQGKSTSQIFEDSFYSNYQKLQSDWLDTIK